MQRSPTFLAPGTSFTEDRFSTDLGVGDGFRMILIGSPQPRSLVSTVHSRVHASVRIWCPSWSDRGANIGRGSSRQREHRLQTQRQDMVGVKWGGDEDRWLTGCLPLIYPLKVGIDNTQKNTVSFPIYYLRSFKRKLIFTLLLNTSHERHINLMSKCF